MANYLQNQYLTINYLNNPLHVCSMSRTTYGYLKTLVYVPY